MIKMGLLQSKNKREHKSHPRLASWEPYFASMDLPILPNLAICLPSIAKPRFECASNETHFYAKSRFTKHVLKVSFEDAEEFEFDTMILHDYFPAVVVLLIADYVLQRIRIYGNMDNKEIEELSILLSDKEVVNREIELLEMHF